uniref:Tetraspanin n=1 Tax=Timema genevievae TaxID=629358 RepID=A0A7R9K742_TIMGE|nr:unnamed protein product [Timema genevievae]
MALPNRKNRDSDCCSVNFLKYVLQIFNVVFLLAGGCVLGVGIWTLASKHWHISLLSTVTYSVAAGVLVFAGCLALIGAVTGCLSVWRENRCLLLVGWTGRFHAVRDYKNDYL